MYRLVRRLGVRAVTDGADLLQQLQEQLLLLLTSQRIGHQEPGDPEGALVKRQVDYTVVVFAKLILSDQLVRCRQAHSACLASQVAFTCQYGL